MNKTMHAVLSILDRRTDIVGSRELSRLLKMHGIDLTERTVRYYLKMLDRQNYTEVFGKEGRRITAAGRDELKRALVSDKVGFVISKIETLSYLTRLDTERMEGQVILNISLFPQRSLRRALVLLKPVFASPYVMSDRVVMAGGRERIGAVEVPQGMAALGTVCSVTINGIFLKAGVPITSRYGGVVEIDGGEAKRFLSLISYDGSSLDPLEIFIKSGMTDAEGAVRSGCGRILASFREIPVVCLDQAQRLAGHLKERGIRGILVIGKPNTPLLGVPVGIDKAGIVVIGGLNPVAVLEEHGIETENTAMSTLVEYSRLVPFSAVQSPAKAVS
ncbi:MAG: NrpR regulatory domain-containing protein [Nitrospiraceae bacterium]|nr:NrpR regulatory domain-containing protein [Nitrospiraceae bacterium]